METKTPEMKRRDEALTLAHRSAETMLRKYLAGIAGENPLAERQIIDIVQAAYVMALDVQDLTCEAGRQGGYCRSIKDLRGMNVRALAVQVLIERA